MKRLIVFYSRTGNTKQVAQALAKSLKADLDEVKDLKDRSGFLGYFIAGYDAFRKKVTEITSKKDPSKYDLILIGTPVWGGMVIPALRTYLEKNKDKIKNKKFAFFCTMGGSGAEKDFNNLSVLINKKPLATLAILEREVKANIFGSKLKEFVDALK